MSSYHFVTQHRIVKKPCYLFYRFTLRNWIKSFLQFSIFNYNEFWCCWGNEKKINEVL